MKSHKNNLFRNFSSNYCPRKKTTLQSSSQKTINFDECSTESGMKRRQTQTQNCPFRHNLENFSRGCRLWLNGCTSVPKCVPRAKKFLPNCSWLTRKSLVKEGFLHLKKFEKLTIQFKPRRVCSSALDVIGCFAPFWINVANEIPSESSTSYYSVNLILR